MWREEALMFHLLKTAVNPKLGLEACIENWDTISMELREPHRQRQSQMDQLADIVSFLS